MTAVLLLGRDAATREAYVRELAGEKGRTLHLIETDAPDVNDLTGEDVWLFAPQAGELSPPMQTRLLRVAQEREVALVVFGFGGPRAALQELVNHGKFREDLYYRISYNTVDLDQEAEDARPRRAAVTESLLALPSELVGLVRQHPTLIDLFCCKGSPRPIELDLDRIRQLLARNPEAILDYGRLTPEAFEAFADSDVAHQWNAVRPYVPFDDTLGRLLDAAGIEDSELRALVAEAGETCGDSRVLDPKLVGELARRFREHDPLPEPLASMRETFADAATARLSVVVITTM